MFVQLAVCKELHVAGLDPVSRCLLVCSSTTELHACYGSWLIENRWKRLGHVSMGVHIQDKEPMSLRCSTLAAFACGFLEEKDLDFWVWCTAGAL